MSNIITSFSVPAESKAAKRLMKWKEDGVIVSHRIQEMLDEDTEPLEQQVEALHRKLWFAAFRLYYPKMGFNKGQPESTVIDVLGFKYTKKAATKMAIQYGWDNQ